MDQDLQQELQCFSYALYFLLCHTRFPGDPGIMGVYRPPVQPTSSCIKSQIPIPVPVQTGFPTSNRRSIFDNYCDLCGHYPEARASTGPTQIGLETAIRLLLSFQSGIQQRSRLSERLSCSHPCLVSLTTWSSQPRDWVRKGESGFSFPYGKSCSSLLLLANDHRALRIIEDLTEGIFVHERFQKSNKKIFTLALCWERCKISGTHEVLYFSNREEHKETPSSPSACVTPAKGLHSLHPSAHRHTWAQHQKEHVTTVPQMNLGIAALWTWNKLTVQNRKLLATGIYFIWLLPSPWDHTAQACVRKAILSTQFPKWMWNPNPLCY